MNISVSLSEVSEPSLRYAKQMGAHGVVLGSYALDSYNLDGRIDGDELRTATSTIASYGLEVFGLRLRPQATFHVLTDGPEAQREIEDVVAIAMSVKDDVTGKNKHSHVKSLFDRSHDFPPNSVSGKGFS